MKLLTIVLSIIFIPVVLLSSIYTFQKDIEVGKQPLEIIYDEVTGGYHIFCDRYDSNFNGIYEPELGETKSTWWLVPSVFSDTAKMLKEFEWDFTYGFSIGYPLRPAVENGIIYFHTNSGVLPYRLSNAELIEDEIVPIGCNAVSIFENKMYLSVRHFPEGGWVADTNYVIVYDMQNKAITDTLPAIANVQQTLCFAKNTFNYDYYLLVLNEGFMGGNDSKLQVYKIYENSYELVKVIDLGDTGNHIYYDRDDEIFVTMNGSHSIQVISTLDFTIKETLTVPTSGYDGPREVGAVLDMVCSSKKDDDKPLYDQPPYLLFVSTYSGIVYVYNGMGIIDSVNTNGKSEGIYVDPHGSGFCVANLFQSGTYSPDSRVSFYSLDLNVEDRKLDNSLFNVYPNPASNFINISSEESLIESIELISLQGITVFQKQLNKENSYKISLESLNLPNGLYFLKIFSGNAISNYPVIIKAN